LAGQNQSTIFTLGLSALAFFDPANLVSPVGKCLEVFWTGRTGLAGWKNESNFTLIPS
jgi:hypothetical protein